MLSITTKDGSLITLSANVLEQITYQNSDLEFLKVISSETLADNIPRISSSADIDILVNFGTLWKENEWFFPQVYYYCRGGKPSRSSQFFTQPQKFYRRIVN